MDINKVHSVLKYIQNNQLTSNEMSELISILNRQLIQQLVGETIIRIADSKIIKEK